MRRREPDAGRERVNVRDLPALERRTACAPVRVRAAEQREFLAAMGRGRARADRHLRAAGVPLRSYLQPFVIMLVIPFGAVGAALGHLIMGYDLTMYSVIGIVALSGVVVNASLVLVDDVNQRRAGGDRLIDAVRDAGRGRLRAIFLTEITTFVGLVPMMFERAMFARFMIPLAISLAFGVLFASVITLLIVPCAAVILEDLQLLASGTQRRRAAERIAAARAEQEAGAAQAKPRDGARRARVTRGGRKKEGAAQPRPRRIGLPRRYQEGSVPCRCSALPAPAWREPQACRAVERDVARAVPASERARQRPCRRKQMRSSAMLARERSARGAADSRTTPLGPPPSAVPDHPAGPPTAGPSHRRSQPAPADQPHRRHHRPLRTGLHLSTGGTLRTFGPCAPLPVGASGALRTSRTENRRGLRAFGPCGPGRAMGRRTC